MTTEEALFLVEDCRKQTSDGYQMHLENGGAGDPAEEVWIDALSTAVSALEKQIPMKIDEKTLIRNDNYNDGTNIPRYDWFCPRCNLETISTKFKYCPCCGQALDWSETE